LGTVHVYPDGMLAVAYDGKLIARFDRHGREVPIQKKLRKVA
jgi:hypothetical protein